MHNDPRLKRQGDIAWCIYFWVLAIVAIALSIVLNTNSQSVRLNIRRVSITNIAGVRIYVETSVTNSRFVNLMALTNQYFDLSFPTGTNTNWIYRMQFKDYLNNEPEILRVTNGGIVQQTSNPKYVQWTNLPTFVNGNGRTQSFAVPVNNSRARIYRLTVSTN